MAHTKEPRLNDLFVMSSLDDLLPVDSQCRVIMNYLTELDFSSLFINFNNDETGRKNHDPKRLLAVWIWGLVRRISSAPLLSRLCKTDIEFRWLCGDNPPCKSTLSDYRVNHLDELSQISSQIQVGLEEIGLLQGKGIVTDGTIFEAAGSKVLKKESIKKKIIEKQKEHKELLSSDDVDKDVALDIENKSVKLTELLDYCDSKGLKQVCTTEPEAHIMKRKNKTFGPAYNVQFNQDDETGAILEHHVADQGNDQGLLLDNVECTKGNYPDIERIGADAGYHKGDDISKLQQDGIHTAIAHPGDRKAPGIDDAYQAKHFTKEKIGFRCPKGHLLNKSNKKNKQTIRWYGAPCQSCPVKDKCMSKPDTKLGRTISESIHNNAIKTNEKQSKDEIGQQQKIARSVFAEGVTMRIKGVLGIARFKTWGKSHVKAEINLYAITYNFLMLCGIWAPLSILGYSMTG